MTHSGSSFATGGPVSKEAARQTSASIEANVGSVQTKGSGDLPMTRSGDCQDGCTEHPTCNTALIGGRWVPAIPLKAPIDVRWCCDHRWTPHVYPQGWDAWNYFDCVRCGVNVEAGVQPENGPWLIRRWLGLRFFAYGRAVRRRSPNPPPDGHRP